MPAHRPSDKQLEERRFAVLALWARGLNDKQILSLLPQDKYGAISPRMLRHDIKKIKESLVETAVDLFGDLQVVVGRHINRTLELRQKAWDAEDWRLVRELDKDMLKIVGINLDRIDINLMAAKEQEEALRVDNREPFVEMVNRIRLEKGLPAVPEDGI